MRIASWNVNSIKVRNGHVQDWLQKHKPDFLMLQELKGMDFPEEDFRAIGYGSHYVNQKARNGVATLYKSEWHDDVKMVSDKLAGDDGDEEARYLELAFKDITLINIYLPNGNPVDTEKYPYKLKWMERLYTRVKDLRKTSQSFLIGGDFNVIPANDDCHDPQAWLGDALFRPETHAAYRKILNLGMCDAFRVNNNQAQSYTFWDYQAGAWQRNAGIRIDHFLLSPSCADMMDGCWIDKEPRALEKPSDHTPIVLDLAA